MEMTGEYRIPAPRERVWQALNDPETLKRAIPGCETIEKVSDSEFTAKVVAKVGPVRATFGGKVNLSDLDPPKAYTISGEGTGGVAGFAKGSAKVKLDEAEGTSTLLRYEVEAHVGGKLAQIGSRLIDATSRKMADDFFSRFAEAVAPSAERTATAAPAGNGAAAISASGNGAATPTGSTATEAEGGPPPHGEPAAAGAETPSSGADETAASARLSPAVWVTALTAAVAGLLYYFTRKGAPR